MVIRLISLFLDSLSLSLTSSRDPSLTPQNCFLNAYQMLVACPKIWKGRDHVSPICGQSLVPNTVADNAGLLNIYQVIKFT